MPVTDVANRFIRHCEMRNLSASTIDGYRWALSKLGNCSQLPADADQLQGIIASGDLSPQSRVDLWSRLRTFYRWASAHELVDDTMREVVRPERRRQFPRTFNLPEISSMFEACRTPRDSAMIAVLLDTGVRVGELWRMTWALIEDDGMIVTGKTGDRFVPLTPRVRGLLEGLGDEGRLWVGPRRPLSLHGIKQAVRRIVYRAGIQPPRAGAHTMRHTFGHLYIKHGGDPFSLQRIMGHSTITSTMTYVHMNSRDLIERYQRFAPSQHLKFPN